MGSDQNQRHLDRAGNPSKIKMESWDAVCFCLYLWSRQCCIILYDIDLLVDTEQNLLHLVYVIAHE